MVVRDARPDDAPRLGEVNVATWQRAYRGLVPDDYLDSLTPNAAEARWRGRIQDRAAGVHLLVAEVDGVVAGYATGGPYRTQQDAEPEVTDGWGELWAIYTHPGFQGRGAGAAVHDELLSRLAADGWTTVALWVLRDNAAARAWYEARGWHRDGASSDWLGSGVPLLEVRFVHHLA